jgi:serine/threonine-protein phosphatase 2A regulatory subunit B''
MWMFIDLFIWFYFAELETKRILLDIFKEKQKKSAEAGTIPSFYKKAC